MQSFGEIMSAMIFMVVLLYLVFSLIGDGYRGITHGACEREYNTRWCYSILIPREAVDASFIYDEDSVSAEDKELFYDKSDATKE